MIFCRSNLHEGLTHWGKVGKHMEIQEISTLLLMYVNADDVVGARSLLKGVNKRDRKSIVAKRFDCNPPLFVAAMHGNVDMVECLANEWQADMEELGGFMNLLDNTRHQVTPLCFAGVLNHLEVMNLLINLGADINASSDTGYTPMLYACKMMNVDVVRSLVCNGADVQRPNNYGETSLMIAVDQCCEEICEILLENGADVNARCFLTENTALHRAVAKVNYPFQEAIVQLLIDIWCRSVLNKRTRRRCISKGESWSQWTNSKTTVIRVHTSSEMLDRVVQTSRSILCNQQRHRKSVVLLGTCRWNAMELLTVRYPRFATKSDIFICPRSEHKSRVENALNVSWFDWHARADDSWTNPWSSS